MSDDLRADLAKLAAVSDDEIRLAARRVFIAYMAKVFKVPVAFAEMRLANTGPYRAPPPTPREGE